MNPRALVLLPLAAAMVALAAVTPVLETTLRLLGVGDEALPQVTPWAAAALAGCGFVLLVIALVGMATTATRRELFGPYTSALKPFAAEFGRGVAETPEGLKFELTRDGQRVEVRLDPRGGGGCTVTSPAPARQSLAWLSPGAPKDTPAAAWREVERTEGWQMRAELPAMARPLLADPALMEVIGRFFQSAEAQGVVHTLSGMVVQSRLPAVDDADALVRLSVEIAFRLRRVNG